MSNLDGIKVAILVTDGFEQVGLLKPRQALDAAGEMARRVRVAKLNVDENPRTAARFNLRSIPTLLVMKGGREIDRIVGAQPKAEITRRLERAVA